jgi:AGZA family xanthine/uracil permease-like MFS transporter
VAPISFQAETITLAGTMSKDLRERLSMIFFGGLIMTVISLFGQSIINFVGPVITNGMMAGVGIMLSAVAVNMAKSGKEAADRKDLIFWVHFPFLKTAEIMSKNRQVYVYRFFILWYPKNFLRSWLLSPI